MKKVLIALSLLAVFCLPTVFASASTGTYAWYWTMCNGLTVKGNYEIQANVGSPYVVISWAVPPSSYENNFGCQKMPFTMVDFAATTNIGFPYLPVATSHASPYSSSSMTLTLMARYCVWTKWGQQCGNPQPHAIQYGNIVTVTITAIYGTYFNHGVTDSLKVTS